MMDRHDGLLGSLVIDSFSFLTRQGFRVVSASDTEVRFENHEAGTFVRVFHDKIDKYLGYRVGLLTHPKDALTAAEVDSLEGHGDTPGLYPETADELPVAVKELARRLEGRGSRALGGEPEIFAEAQACGRDTRLDTPAGRGTADNLSALCFDSVSTR